MEVIQKRRDGRFFCLLSFLVDGDIVALTGTIILVEERIVKWLADVAHDMVSHQLHQVE